MDTAAEQLIWVIMKLGLVFLGLRDMDLFNPQCGSKDIISMHSANTGPFIRRYLAEKPPTDKLYPKYALIQRVYDYFVTRMNDLYNELPGPWTGTVPEFVQGMVFVWVYVLQHYEITGENLSVLVNEFSEICKLPDTCELFQIPFQLKIDRMQEITTRIKALHVVPDTIGVSTILKAIVPTLYKALYIPVNTASEDVSAAGSQPFLDMGSIPESGIQESISGTGIREDVPDSEEEDGRSEPSSSVLRKSPSKQPTETIDPRDKSKAIDTGNEGRMPKKAKTVSTEPSSASAPPSSALAKNAVRASNTSTAKRSGGNQTRKSNKPTPADVDGFGSLLDVTADASQGIGTCPI